MHILVISGSPRKGGNTEIMADAFAQGAREAGHTVTVKEASALKVAPCLACEYCFAHDGVCVQKDDMAGILEEVDKADMLVFASPIYWFNLSAQIKAIIDRLYARARKGFHPTSTALLLDSMSPGVFDGAVAAYRATNAYLRWEDKGVFTISGMDSKGAMNDSPDLQRVRDFGKGLK